ncbi:MAG: nucleoside hydrolase [Chloroflexi bacterium]|nr:nucleoside hydrolase [Chloroflexota bacterium]
MSQKIILDVDPGHDDAMAILLANASPEIDLLAITTVAGNQTLPKTTLNARRVCSRAGIRDVPIAAGCDRPLVREQRVAANIHGESGLEGPTFAGEPDVPLDPRHAVDLIVELLMASDGDIMLVPTGPLTNIGMAMRREPRILPKIRHIALMGGAWGFGNQTPSAEFNILVDPEAARIVFESGVPLTMCGLELTHQAKATPDIIQRFADLHTPLGDFAVEMLQFFASTYRRMHGFDGPPLHDPTAVAWVIDPTMVETQPAHVDIETHAEFSYGRTVVDLHDVLGLPKNVQVATKLDVPRFWDLMVGAIASYGA